ncbi:MAG: hypothetical protein HEQ13_06430 [Dolichospermum sp. DEX189]|jgi:hypothetical protein|nr:hypothetical protein [Dolichospermum sp. DEX189]
MIIISGTSPLSNLAIVGYLSLLQQIYNKVIIPQGVAEELRNASDEENLIAGVLSLDWIEVIPAKNLELISIYLITPGSAVVSAFLQESFFLFITFRLFCLLFSLKSLSIYAYRIIGMLP